MAEDFTPVCPVHQTEMVAATHWVKLNGKPFPKPVFVCDQECLHVFDPVTNSYSALPDDALIGQPIDYVVSRFRS
jgi:hypothetical protein